MNLNEDKYLGCLVGLAAGDAVGTTLEFSPKGSFSPITDMCGGGPFDLKAGQWTDDTSMALCLANSLIKSDGFDPVDQMNRYCNWFHFGYLSSTGSCFDIGRTVVKALGKYIEKGDPFAGSMDPKSAGNGSIMRLAPVVLYYSPNVDDFIHYSGESSRTTHGAAECIDACRYLGAVLHLALSGAAKNSFVNTELYKPYTDGVKRIYSGEYLSKERGDIYGKGYVIQSLEAALWCFYKTNSFKEAILEAANLGDDADTTAAICGQIAGAFYGCSNIPEDWRNKISYKEDIEKLALSLMYSANSRI